MTKEEEPKKPLVEKEIAVDRSTLTSEKFERCHVCKFPLTWDDWRGVWSANGMSFQARGYLCPGCNKIYKNEDFKDTLMKFRSGWRG